MLTPPSAPRFDLALPAQSGAASILSPVESSGVGGGPRPLHRDPRFGEAKTHPRSLKAESLVIRPATPQLSPHTSLGGFCSADPSFPPTHTGTRTALLHTCTRTHTLLSPRHLTYGAS